MKEPQHSNTADSISDSISDSNVEFFDTIVIGAGQTGLSIGYNLTKKMQSFIIIDANKRIGDSWRNRWDSLKLFTPAYMDNLEGLKLPGKKHGFISKDEMADYLEKYAVHFNLPIRSNVRVTSLYKKGGHFILATENKLYESKNVIVAMSSDQDPKIPKFAKDINPSITQLHSKEYKNTSQLKKGTVLIVGAGNSGADIAMDVVKKHTTFISGRDVGHLSYRIETFFARYIRIKLEKFIFHHFLTTNTVWGRKLKPKMISKGGLLVRVKPIDFIEAGIERLPKVVAVKNGLPVLEDGRIIEVDNIIWCTGYHPGFSWIDLPVFDEINEPKQLRGVVEIQAGLYFVGLRFLFGVTSHWIDGMQRDAKYIVKQIVKNSFKK